MNLILYIPTQSPSELNVQNGEKYSCRSILHEQVGLGGIEEIENIGEKFCGQQKSEYRQYIIHEINIWKCSHRVRSAMYRNTDAILPNNKRLQKNNSHGSSLFRYFNNRTRFWYCYSYHQRNFIGEINFANWINHCVFGTTSFSFLFVWNRLTALCRLHVRCFNCYTCLCTTTNLWLCCEN